MTRLIDDTAGHQAGDELLKIIAGRLRLRARGAPSREPAPGQLAARGLSFTARLGDNARPRRIRTAHAHAS
jgi:GGDEF domain-containing protein